MDAVRHPVRWMKEHPDAADAALAGALVLIAIGSMWADPAVDAGVEFRSRDPLTVVLLLGSSMPLAWRRRRPVAVLVVAAICAVAYELAGYPSSAAPIGVLVALYTVAAHCDRRTSRLCGAFTGLGLLAVLLGSRWHPDLGSFISNFVIFGTAWLIGDNLQTRRAYVAQLQERAERAEADQQAEARRAVADERARIARELHDVVAHGMSVMIVQADGARRVLDRDPARAAEALDSIESTGREAMVEMRRLLGVLRDELPDGDRDPELAPQPGLAGLPTLVEHCREAGLPVEVEVEGVAGPLPPGIDLAAYRIVQEALTNTLKHAGPARAVVRVRYSPGAVEVEVVDDGRGGAADAGGAGSGHGLVGMRERVDLYGGDLRAGLRPGGGYAVTARLPLEVAHR